MKLLIAATIFAAVLPAATINFTTANTTLAGGEVITIGAASATFTAIPASLTLQITGNTAVNGSPLMSWSIDVPWDVDGEASLLHVTGVFQPSGGNWSIYSIAWPKTALGATNVEFGYPVQIKPGGMLSPVAGGTLGAADDGPLIVNVGLATPEPGTFALAAIFLCCIWLGEAMRAIWDLITKPR